MKAFSDAVIMRTLLSDQKEWILSLDWTPGVVLSPASMWKRANNPSVQRTYLSRQAIYCIRIGMKSQI